MKNLKLILSVLLFALTSCGYQFEGGGYLNSDVTSVAMGIMDNQSSETQAGVIFTSALIKEILEKTDTKLVDEVKAVAVLKGRVNAITFATLSRSTTQAVIERRVSASVDMQLVDRDGKTIWSVKNFTTHEEFKVSEDKITDENNIRAAVDKISIRTAERLIIRMMNNF